MPVVSPSKTPDRISGTSGSFLWVVIFDCPGRRALEVRQEIGRRQLDPRRYAVDDHHVAGPMALAGGGDAEKLAEGITWHDGDILTPGELEEAGIGNR